MKCGLTCSGHVVEHVPPLQAQRGDDSQDPFDKPAPFRDIGSEAAFSPQDTLTENSLREVVRGVDPFDGDEGPEGGLQGQNFATPSRDEAGGTRGSLLDPSHEDVFHQKLDLALRQAIIAAAHRDDGLQTRTKLACRNARRQRRARGRFAGSAAQRVELILINCGNDPGNVNDLMTVGIRVGANRSDRLASPAP